MELLAPAGGMLQAKTAVINGANAIYLGAEEFSARSSANNFSRDELLEIVSFCHARGVDVHLAVNTLLLNQQFSDVAELLTFARKIGIDAFIVQDWGVVRMIRTLCPDVPIHASTQMTVCNSEGVRIAEKMGLSRVVLARELSLDEIKEITQNTNLEIEVFVHGAICVCYSGQCLLSSMLGGRSGNRGACAQPCRKLYRDGKREGYFLSPADMCLIEHLKELEDAGVDSVKIEGRMKSAEYVGTVTSIYRKYLDSKEKVSPEDMEILKNAFCRGDTFTDGYLTGKTGYSMMRPDVSNDRIHEQSDRKQLEKHANVYQAGKTDVSIPISGKWVGNIGDFAILTITDESGDSVSEKSTICVEKSETAPLTAQRIKAQLSKLGGTPFCWQELEVSWEDGFLPISEINQMRRIAIETIMEKRIKNRERSSIRTKYEPEMSISSDRSFYLQAIVENASQANALMGEGIQRIFIPLEEYEKVTSKDGTTIVVTLPPILNTKKMNEYRERLKSLHPSGILCSNIGHLELAKECGIDVHGSFRLNILNNHALAEAKKNGLSDTILSVELNHAQIKDIFAHASIPIGCVIYGKLPLMTTKNCIVQSVTGGSCDCQNSHIITDQNHTALSIRPNGSCGSFVYNTKPIYLADKMDEIKACMNRGTLLFTDESPTECAEILREYMGADKRILPTEFTRGHWNRGVQMVNREKS